LWLSSRKKGERSFNNFLTKRNSTNNNSKIIIVADFSNLIIGNIKSRELLDLKGANFIGSIFHNTSFIGCDLRNARFCGVHLEKVLFKESSISFIDFSRADLSSCSFDNSYCTAPWSGTEGAKFSSTVSCIRIYADIKNITKKIIIPFFIVLINKIEFLNIRKIDFLRVHLKITNRLKLSLLILGPHHFL
jgi:uncharacterized protein YjbI with pentapeptide repeats